MAYFDNAATTFTKPQSVVDAVHDAMQNLNVNYGRGQHALASKAYSLVEETRELVQNVMGTWNKKVVFAPTATESLNVLIKGVNSAKLEAGEHGIVFISPFEHNAVTRTLKSMEPDESGAFSAYSQSSVHEIFTKVIDPFGDFVHDIELGIESGQPMMCVMTHASNVTGDILPIKEVFGHLKKLYGDKIVTVLDMAQTAGKSCAENIANLDIVDAVVFSGHKSLYAPFGASGMLIKPELDIAPLIFGGTGFDSANQEMPTEIPERFEVGSMNIAAIAGLNAACKWRLENRRGIDSVEAENYQKLVSALNNAGLNVIHTAGANDALNAGVASVLPPGSMSVDSYGQLLSKHDVQVRTGLHCAPLAHQSLGTFPSGTVRFSTSYFNTGEDFIKLEKAIKEIGE